MVGETSEEEVKSMVGERGTGRSSRGGAEQGSPGRDVETDAIRGRPRGAGVGKVVVMSVVAFLLGVGVGGVLLGNKNPSGGSSTCSGTSELTLTGAGATFPYPLIDKWRFEYNKICNNIQVNYQSIGSGGGIQQITARTVDFGASDAPLKASERTAAPGLLHLPETLGAVAIVYNVPDVASGLKLTADVIADIFLGNVRRWNDPALANLNPTVTLPDQDIFTVHRSDGSGTTFVFTDYLTKASPAWAAGPGKGKSVTWPLGFGAKGNEGVAGVVLGNRYSIGYVELAYAFTNNINFAEVRNAVGNFVSPSLNSTTAAAVAAAPTLPSGSDSWEPVSITDAPGAESYPIASFSYVLVYQEQTDRAKGQALVDFLWWVIHDGQQYSSALLYVPLPSSVVAINEASIRTITHQGSVLYTG